ncbi:TPA: hypothetical protein ACGO1T_001916 [Streptococcus suis]
MKVDIIDLEKLLAIYPNTKDDIENSIKLQINSALMKAAKQRKNYCDIFFFTDGEDDKMEILNLVGSELHQKGYKTNCGYLAEYNMYTLEIYWNESTGKDK